MAIKQTVSPQSTAFDLTVCDSVTSYFAICKVVVVTNVEFRV